MTNVEENYMEEPKKDRQERDILKEIMSWFGIVIAAFISAFIITNFIIINAKIPTGSMENTIMAGDRVIGFRWSYLFSNPKRGDVVVFKFPDDESQNYVKRIIGLPGETVEIKSGIVYINGVALEENYLKETPYRENFGPYEVPERHYFMMGDNRNRSADAREWTNKYVAKNKILGKVKFRYYPSFKIIK